MPDSGLVYWDASVFLSYINEIPGRVDIIEELLMRARTEKRPVYTSTVSITEVAYAESEVLGSKQNLPVTDNIENLWNDRTVVQLIDVSQVENREARTLIRKAREQGLSLKPMDAIHLATAKQHGISKVFTYDDKWKRYESITGLTISEPYLDQPTLGLTTDAEKED